MNKTARDKGHNIHTNKTQQPAFKYNALFGHYLVGVSFLFLEASRWSALRMHWFGVHPPEGFLYVAAVCIRLS
jgi:hypothetical protein